MEAKTLPLSELGIGQKGIVVNITSTPSEKIRFWDLGLIRGTIVQSLHKSPSGNPIAYSIMGAVIALRNCDANKISVLRHESITPEFPL